MSWRFLARVALGLALTHPAAARPVARYVFDRSGTQNDLGIAPVANATFAGSAQPVYSSPNTYSCAALDLTANGANHNYVATAGDIEKLDALGAMTVTLWVNMRGTAASQDCLVGDMATWNAPAGQGGWELRIAEPTASSFKVDFEVEETYGGSANLQGFASQLINAPSQWVFIAVTYAWDPAYQGYRRTFYLGREAVGVAELEPAVIFSFPLRNNASEFRVGSASSEPTTDRTPPAWIDDVRVYDYALTQGELEQVRQHNLINQHLYDSPAFFGIGSLRGTVCTSWAIAVSGDGSTVVGQTITASNMVRALRWKEGVVQVAVNQPPTWTRGSATEVSFDGSVIVGYGAAGTLITDYRPFRWAGDQVTVLDPLPGGDDSGWAYSVTADGSVVVGTSSGQTAANEGFRWENGITELIPMPAGAQVLPLDISPDGEVIVGVITQAIGDYRAFRLENGIMQELGPILSSNGLDSRIRISADKQSIVGWADLGSGREAVLWRGGRTFGLGDLPGGAFLSEATAVSGHGSRIVGMSRIGTTESAAFFWDRTHGMRNLKTVLGSDYGLDMEGWRMSWATGISDDGTTIVGYGMNPAGVTEGWLARLPELPHPVDLDGDQDVDGEDVQRFAACATGAEVPYADGNVPAGCTPGVDVLGVLPADLDWDGDVDQDDFAILQRCYGGPGIAPEQHCTE